jgi:hypothetical protein
MRGYPSPRAKAEKIRVTRRTPCPPTPEMIIWIFMLDSCPELISNVKVQISNQ